MRANERTDERVPLLQSVFLVILAHSGMNANSLGHSLGRRFLVEGVISKQTSFVRQILALMEVVELKENSFSASEVRLDVHVEIIDLARDFVTVVDGVDLVFVDLIHGIIGQTQKVQNLLVAQPVTPQLETFNVLKGHNEEEETSLDVMKRKRHSISIITDC